MGSISLGKPLVENARWYHFCHFDVSSGLDAGTNGRGEATPVLNRGFMGVITDNYKQRGNGSLSRSHADTPGDHAVTGIAFALNEQGKQRGKCKSCGRRRKKCQIDLMKVLVELDALILRLYFLHNRFNMTPRSHNPRTNAMWCLCRSGGTNRDVSIEVIPEEDADHWAVGNDTAVGNLEGVGSVL
jgi:hypothetical protein